MRKVKICGLTRVEDVEAAVALGADLLGLNFWPQSPRAIDVETGRRLAQAARQRAAQQGRADRKVLIAGVFVNQPRLEIEAVDRAVGLDLIQLHGDESPDFCAAFGGRLLRALRIAGTSAAAEFVAYPGAWGFLVDVADGVRYGGTGQEWNYSELAAVLSQQVSSHGRGTLWDTGQPVLIAGGIRPGNAHAALVDSGAWGVDLCSGVESAPGIKDTELMRAVILEVHHGQGATTP